MAIDMKKFRRAIEDSLKADAAAQKQIAAALDRVNKLDASLDKMAAALKAQKKNLGELE